MSYRSFVDAPGLGEDMELDGQYLNGYDANLPSCDVILWVLSARNRALALDQGYLKRFQEHAAKVVIAINQTDIVHPNNWAHNVNLPSGEQSSVLEGILKDRQARLSRVADRDLPAILYSAERRWRLVELLNLVMSACSPERRWMFDLLSHVKPDDFVPANLSEADLNRIKMAQRNTQAKKMPPNKKAPYKKSNSLSPLDWF